MKKTKLRPGLPTLASVALLTSTFPPLEFHPLVWVAMVPWLWGVWRCASAGEALVQGLWLSFLFGGASTLWIVPAVPLYLDVSLGFGVGIALLHALFCQLQLAAFAPLFHWQSKRPALAVAPRGLLLAALLYVGLDWLFPNIFKDSLGATLHSYRAIRQAAELGGLPLLTFVVVVVNLGLFQLLVIAQTGVVAQRSRAAQCIGTLTVIVLVFWSWGAMRYDAVTALIAESERTLRIGMVQGGVSNELKKRSDAGDPEAAREALQAYVDGSDALLGRSPRPDLVLWPEMAYPAIYRRPENDFQLALNVGFDRYIASHGTPMIFGAYDREERVDQRVLRNALYFVQPERGQAVTQLSPMEIYQKSILFPVGEYLPGFDRATARRWLPGAGHFSAGKGPAVFDLTIEGRGTFRLGPMICYEDLFARHAGALARLGAEVLVNVSNDAWFGNTGAPRHHLIFARLRSIETRLPQVRATNTGYSALILPNGDVPVVSEYGRAESLDLVVPVIGRQQTLASLHSGWFGWSSLLVATLGMMVARRYPR